MAAIADLQSESIDITLNQVHWTDNGEVNTLKRAPHGGSYSTLATVTGLTTYQDSTAVTGTYYDYKITSGVSGDSNVSSVVTQVCSTANPSGASLVGQYSQDTVTPEDFNNLIDDLNKTLQPESSQLLPCEVCPSNGAIVLDCTTCSHFTVIVNTDINSVSMINCQDVGEGSINLEVPANTTPKVCGFPTALGFDGGECHKNPGTLTGGTSGSRYRVLFGGRSVNRGKRQLQSKGKTGGTPKGLPLTLTCKTSTGGVNANCSIDCVGVKAMQVVATGGTPPYTFSVTGGLGLSTVGSTSTVTPPANSGSGVAGTAYRYGAIGCEPSAPFTVFQGLAANFGCNDVSTGVCTNLGSCSSSAGCSCWQTFLYSGYSAGQLTIICSDGNPHACTGCSGSGCGTCNNLATSPGSGKMLDVRTAPMIAAGCNPCGISVNAKVVTVTDATGTQVSKTIIA